MEDDFYRGMHIPKGSLVRFPSSVVTCPQTHTISGLGIREYLASWLPIEAHSQTTLMVFLRAMLRDEKLYPNADKFYPERFNEKVDPDIESKRDPRNYVFGFGRRYIMLVSFLFNHLNLSPRYQEMPRIELGGILYLVVTSFYDGNLGHIQDC
jgi:hypothetical protein